MVNIFQVAEVDKNLTVNDMRQADIQSCDKELWIYWTIPRPGKATGFKGVRKLTIRQTQNLIDRLQAAVDLAEAHRRGPG